MNLPINAANVLFVLSYFTTDMSRLRLLSAVGTALAVACFCSQPEPMLNVVAWNVLVLELNVVQLARMVAERGRCSARARRRAGGPIRRPPKTPALAA